MGTQIEVAPAQRHIIRRPRLERLLDETSARVILLVAPAGYGKTTLARQWLEDKPHVWYQATPAGCDIAALASGLVRVLQASSPEIGQRLLERLRAIGPPYARPSELVDLLAPDLQRVGQDTWIVIDDYQLLAESPESEQLIEFLCSWSNSQFLLISRGRPRWCTARRILYGEVCEAGRTALALTPEETERALAARPSGEARGLCTLSEGWPAVIGLAALTVDAIPTEDSLPETLYEFFAEELFQTASPRLREALPYLVITPRATRGLLSKLLGTDSSAVLSEASDAGLTSIDGTGHVELHPLFRSFLEQRFINSGAEELACAAERSAKLLLEARRWDEVFEIVQQWPSHGLAESLLDASLDDLLAEGRLTTLARWLSFARTLGPSPIFDLVEAELSFLRGEYVRAESKALRAAETLMGGHPRLSRAYYRAGRAAYFEERPHAAFDHYEKARSLSTTEADLHEALRGLVLVAVVLELPQTVDYWNMLAALRSSGPDDDLRRAATRLFVAANRGGVQLALEEVKHARELVPDVRDPILRSGFLNTVGYTHILAGEYEEGLDAILSALEDIDAYHLEFARAHALLNQARAEIGLRRFLDAERHIALAARTDSGRRDIHIRVNIEIAQTKLALNRGQTTQPLSRGREDLLLLPVPDFLRGELLATRALEAACREERLDALRLANEARATTQNAEAVTLAALADAIAHRESPADAFLVLERAFDTTVATGVLDAFVLAYRGYNDLLSLACAANSDLAKCVGGIVERAADVELARKLDLPIPKKETLSEVLSPREREVVSLVKRGLSNKEIARELFISEPTVKVHMQHIFDKFGVRSRTQVATLASQETD